MLSSLQDHHHTGESIVYNNSEYIYGGDGSTIGVTPTGYVTGFSTFTDGGWDQDADGLFSMLQEQKI